MTRTGTSTFPGTIDSFDRVTSSTYENDVGYYHVDLHNEAMDALEKIETAFPITNVSAKGTSYVLTTSDSKILATSGANTQTLTLPTAVGVSGKVYSIKKLDNVGTVVVDTTSSQTIDGSLTAPITVQYLSLDVVSDGANWSII